MTKFQRSLTIFIIVLGIGLSLGTLILLSSERDFVILYAADVSLVHGVNPYDAPAVSELFVSLRGGQPEDYSFPPLAYPPWYLLTTFYLGWLSPALAARIWYMLNVTMIVGAVWLLTENWPLKKRALAASASLLFLPVFGLLSVGQFTAPLLFGTALFLRSVRRESVWEAVPGLLLLTFKPNLGVWILLAGLGWLACQRSRRSYFYRLLGGMLLGGFLLGGVSLIFIPTWPWDYWHALRGFGAMTTFAACDTCASLSLALAAWFTGQAGMTWGILIGLGLLLLISGGIALWKRSLLRSLYALLALVALLTLLLMPYGMDYDYILLIVPFLWLARRARRPLDWLMPGLAYFVPWLLLLLSTRQWLNISLIFSAVLLLAAMISSHAQEASAA